MLNTIEIHDQKCIETLLFVISNIYHVFVFYVTLDRSSPQLEGIDEGLHSEYMPHILKQ